MQIEIYSNLEALSWQQKQFFKWKENIFFVKMFGKPVSKCVTLFRLRCLPARKRHKVSLNIGDLRWFCLLFSAKESFAVGISSRAAFNLFVVARVGAVFLQFLSHLLVAGCDIGVRFSVRPSVRPSVRQSVSPSVSPSVRLSTFMSTFDIYVKVSILINYKTKQPSNLAWNISLTSWLCNIGVRFSVCLSIRPSVCQHLCRSSTFMSKLVF